MKDSDKPFSTFKLRIEIKTVALTEMRLSKNKFFQSLVSNFVLYYILDKIVNYIVLDKNKERLSTLLNNLYNHLTAIFFSDKQR